MTIRYLLPDLGEGLVVATIEEWLIEVGEQVFEDQPIVVVDTLKAAVELPSPVDGIIVRFGAQAGEVLGVGALLVEIEPNG